MISSSLEVEKTDFDAEIRVQTPDQLNKFLEEEANLLKNRVLKLTEIGANVVFCQKGVDDKAQNILAKEGVITVRRVKRSDMEKLARASNAKIINNISDITPDDLLGKGTIVIKGNFGKWLFIDEWFIYPSIEEFPSNKEIFTMKNIFRTEYTDVIKALEKLKCVNNLSVKFGYVMEEN